MVRKFIPKSREFFKLRGYDWTKYFSIFHDTTNIFSLGNIFCKMVGDYLNEGLYKAGFEVPIVFNNTDLSMGDNWMVLHKRLQNGNWTLVPITGEDGNRMNYYGCDLFYFTNDNSDFLYFGTTLKYRRKLLNAKDFSTFHEVGFGKESIEKRIKYDYRKTSMTKNVTYKVVVYSNNSSKVIHWKPNAERHQRKLKYECILEYNGQELRKQN